MFCSLYMSFRVKTIRKCIKHFDGVSRKIVKNGVYKM